MPRRRTVDLAAAEGLLGRAVAVLPGAQACFDLLAASLLPQLSDARRARGVGRILDEIARRKLYRLSGHATLDGFLMDALRISRTTAYRLRQIARAPGDEEVPRRERWRPTRPRVGSPRKLRATAHNAPARSADA